MAPKHGFWLIEAPEADHAAQLRLELEARGAELLGCGAMSTPYSYGIVAAGPDLQATANVLRELPRSPHARVIVVSPAGSCNSLERVMTLFAAGADDHLTWGEHATAGIVARTERWLAVDEALRSNQLRERIVGESAAWVRVLRGICEAALFTDAPVLLLGESGTGKEQLARVIHELDRRNPKGKLVVADCTTVTPGLSGSEFFGHERGAFTGAVCSRDGAFAMADGGTLFLDELGELPGPLQAQLLRAIQEKVFKRVGGNNWVHTEFRLVSATNRDLCNEVERGHFRADLFHRIAAFVFHVPPLRERRNDIVPLAESFARAALGAASPVTFDEMVKEYLVCRDYAGNVRELKQLVRRMCALHVGPAPISLGDLPKVDMHLQQPADETLGCAVQELVARGSGLEHIKKRTRQIAIQTALAMSNNRIKLAAQLLKTSDRALQMELKRERAPS